MEVGPQGPSRESIRVGALQGLSGGSGVAVFSVSSVFLPWQLSVYRDDLPPSQDRLPIDIVRFSRVLQLYGWQARCF